MGKIKLLENSMINKIAAGEVVERPSSVVKELVENSIDAGASVVTIEINDGGTTLIRITDNGSGIEKADVKSAFLRHATSKISDFDDLETLLTLGFRGEALASIASVSQVELITKTERDITGTRIEIHGGEIVTEQEIGASSGTTFIIRNLFYNTPARRKFLKKASSEAALITDIINKLALGHPEVAFKYINSNSVLIQTSGSNNLEETILAVYGKDVAKKILRLDYEKEDFKISGYIGKPELARANRNYENFFINGRFIKSGLLSSAIEEAYKTRLMTQKFPLFVINIETLPKNVDINVHPTKLEVRFSDEDFIYNLIMDAVLKVFKDKILIPSQGFNLLGEKIENDYSHFNQSKTKFSDVNKSEVYKAISEVSFDSLKEFKVPDISAINNDNILMDKNKTENFFKESIGEEKPLVFREPIAAGSVLNDNMFEVEENVSGEVLGGEEFAGTSFEEDKANTGSLEKEESSIKRFFSNYKIVGQLFATYWIVEQNGCMYLIDQHAAHEKVLYESFTNSFREKAMTTQRLLSPEAVNLSSNEYQRVKDNWELLAQFGFDVEEFGENTVAIRGVPYIFNAPSNTSFFVDIVDKLQDVETSIKNIYDTKIDAIATISCKAAVKANDKLSYVEAKSLIEDLLKLENPFSCPHGRPIIVEVSKVEIEKKFKRIV